MRYLIFSLLLAVSFSSIAQLIKLNGKVFNEKNEPLPSISIKLTGGGGTTTDIAGRFSLSLTPGKKYEITFTGIGYEPKTINDVEVGAGLSNELDVVLQVKAQTGDNVIVSAFNSIIMGWPVGIEVDATTGTSTALNIEDSTLRLRNVTLAGNAINTKFSGTGGATINNDAAFAAWFTNPYYNNDILATTAEVKLNQPFNYTAPDPTPFAAGNGNAKVLNGGGFTDARFNGDSFFDKTVTFRGGIAPAGELSSWWKGWTRFNYN